MKKIILSLLLFALPIALTAQTVTTPWRNLGKAGSDLADLETRNASDLTNAPAGSIAATDAQAAINELDSEKATTAQGALADSATQPGDNVSTLTNDSGYLTSTLAAQQFAARSPDSGLVWTGVSGARAFAPAIALGTSNLFVRTKVFLTGLTSAEARGIWIFGGNDASPPSSNGGILAFIDGASGRLIFQSRDGAGTTNATVSETTARTGLADLVLVRIGTTVNVYIDGLLYLTNTDADWAQSFTSNFFTLGLTSGNAASTLNGAMQSAEYGNFAPTAAEVLTLHRFGWAALPEYVLTAGAGTTKYSTDFSSSTGWTLSGSSTISGGKLNLTSNNTVFAPASYPLVGGRAYVITITVDSITGGSAQYYNGSAYVSYATTAGTYVIPFIAAGSYVQTTLRISGGSGVLDDYSVTTAGVAGSWDFNSGAGYQQRDLSGGKRPMTLTTTGVQRLRPDRQGSVTGSLTWADTHEAKSLLGQEALPSNAIIDAITFVATAGSSGDGITIGTTTNPDQFVAVNSYTTTAENFAGSQIASPFPGGTATNDLTIVVDPDTANYTGSITTTVTYHLANY